MSTVPFSFRAPVKFAHRKDTESKHTYRSDFMRDRDRIMYCKAFRRLSSKTQIFVAGFDDHARNRLTHTLEVSQIARTISQILKLDVDLTEAIALGHDLGHTPFGHVGERTLNLIMNGCDPLVRDYCNLGRIRLALEEPEKGFKHNLQSVRIAVDLESSIDHKKEGGINLTNFTLFGLKNHSKPQWSNCKSENDGLCFTYPKSFKCENDKNISVGYYNKYEEYLINPKTGKEAWSFEAYVVAWADEIAQRHHDMEDAIEGKLLSKSEALDLVEKHFSHFFDKNDMKNLKALKNTLQTELFFPQLSRLLVNFLVSKLVEASSKNLRYFAKSKGLRTMKDFENNYSKFLISDVNNIIGLRTLEKSEDKLSRAHEEFQGSLKEIVLNAFNVHRMDGKAQFIIRKLFKAYLTNPQQLPDKTVQALFREFKRESPRENKSVYELRHEMERLKKFYSTDNNDEGVLADDTMNFRVSLLRTICDYIAGMTDSYALKEYKSLYS